VIGSSKLGRGTGTTAVKLYYRIGEVAGIVGVEPHVLRYWETEFPSIRPQKSRSGQRVYSRKDVDRLLRVKELLYAQRFTIAGARQRLKDSSSEPGAQALEASALAPVPETGAEPLATATEAAKVDQLGLRSAAQALRETLLAVRSDVCRMLESLEVQGSPDALGVSSEQIGEPNDAFEVSLPVRRTGPAFESER